MKTLLVAAPARTRTPTRGRFFLQLVLPLLLTGTALAQAPLTEGEAVRQALAQPHHAAIIEAATGLAQAQAVQPWADPDLTYERQQLDGTQSTLMIEQRFDVSGRRALRAAAAGHRAEAIEHRGALQRVALRAAVQRRFYDHLLAQAQITATEAWLQHIDRALSIVARREAAGDASAYDRRRVARERATTQGQLALFEAQRAHAGAQLASLMGGDAPATVAGALLPTAASADGAHHPALQAFAADAQAARLDGAAAGRWWVPQLSVGLGWIGFTQGTHRSDGYVAVLTSSVPLFDQLQGEAQQARATARLAQSRQALAERTLLGQAQAQRVALVGLVAAAQQFRAEAVGSSAALIRTAEAGYAGDALGILELLDAYRGGAEDALTALDLERRARRARIELDRLTGATP